MQPDADAARISRISWGWLSSETTNVEPCRSPSAARLSIVRLDLVDELAVTPTARRSVRALERQPESIRVDSGVTLENLEQRRVDGPAQMPHSNCERISGPSSVTSTVFSARAPAGPPSPA